MADHYERSMDLLDEIDGLEKRLLREYAGANRSKTVADLHGRIGRCLKLADIHATLAVRQELQEVATGLQVGGLGVRL